MLKIKRGAGRPPDKRVLIVSDIRGRIVSGELGPEARLPSQAVLEKKFKASSPTVQQALNVLTRDGFIEAFGRRGTFVKKYPPHLFHYAMLSQFGAPGFSESASHFHEILEHQALYLQRLEPFRKLTVYHGITGHTDVSDFLTVSQKLADQCVAGLIFMFPPRSRLAVAESSLYTEPGMPRVQIATEDYAAGLPTVYPDARNFFRRALECLLSRNCRRIALLCMSTNGQRDMMFQEAAAKAGLTVPPHLIHYMPANDTRAANHVAQLLMQMPKAERPQGIVISDDHLVAGATEGLAALNQPADQLPTVVGLVNYPRPPASSVPIIRLGFDCRRLLKTCVDYIDMQRRGEQPPAMTLIPAVFESELP